MQQSDKTQEINILDYWNVLWRRKYVLLALFIVAVVAAMVISTMMPKYYLSETVIISSSSESGGLGPTLSSLPIAGLLGGSGVQTSADKILIILKSRTIADAVISRFKLDRIFNEKRWDENKQEWKDPQNAPKMSETILTLNNITRFFKTKDGAITIRVEWTDPKLAADIANYYVYALTEFLKDKAMTVTIQTIDRAVPADTKSRPIIRVNMMIADIASFLFGILAIFLVELIQKARS